MKTLLGILAAGLLFVSLGALGADPDLRQELDKLKREVEDLRKERATSKPVATSGTVDRLVENKYGPNAAVTTKQGKLTLGGMVQVWYYQIQNDNLGLFGDHLPWNWNQMTEAQKRKLAYDVGDGDSNEGNDNDSYSIRRIELRFTMDIHENVTAVVMIDPAREVRSRPAFPTNVPNGSTLNPNLSNVRDGTSTAGRLLQDAYINVHGILPHHDTQVGQFKPPLGEEGIRPSSALDFAERSMIAQLGDARDLGAMIHGTWWDERFQYWLGAFDGAGNWLAPGMQNRADDNDEKDYYYRVLVRPLWKDEKFGSLELGMSSGFGRHGEAGIPNYVYPCDFDPVTGLALSSATSYDVNGLNREKTTAVRHYAWASYMPGGPVKGWWIRGEWAYIKDRLAPASLVVINDTALALGNKDYLYKIPGKNNYDTPRPFSVQGWYVSTGYKIADSVWAEEVPGWFKDVEFTFRYETFQNIWVADLVRPRYRTDVFRTEVFTAGVNYYIKGHNAKIQVNYNWVDENVGDNDGVVSTGCVEGVPKGAVVPRTWRGTREVRNDSLLVNFQVAW